MPAKKAAGPEKKAAPKTVAATKKAAPRKAAPRKAAPRKAAPRKRAAGLVAPTTYLDGVPCFLESTRRRKDEPLLLGLTFRVGYADESLPVRGFTHLVEHLSLFEASAERLPVNGNVGTTETTLYVRGTSEEVVEVIGMITAALRALPAGRLEDESRVLRTEAASRTRWSLGPTQIYRFGARGYGLATFQEMGLVAPTIERVQAWADRWFTRENCVLWASGPLPEGLVLDLPHGERMAPPTPEPLPWALPGSFFENANVVGLSFLAPRGGATNLAAKLLEERLHRRLRMNAGQSYQVFSFVEGWTPDVVHGILAADTLADHAHDVCHGILEEVQALGQEEPSPEELSLLVADFARGWRDPAAATAAMFASNHLNGVRVRSVALAVEELEAVTPAEVSEAARRIREQGILQVPYGVHVCHDDFAPLPSASLPDAARAVGSPLRRSRTLPGGATTNTLTVGPESVTFGIDERDHATVRADEVVCVQRWDDGAQTWWGLDGLHVFVHPDEWAGGPTAIDQLDALLRHVPRADEVVVDMGTAAGSSYLEEIERRGGTPANVPGPPPVARAARKGLAALRRRKA